jgi:hypothetical protein
MNFEQAGEFGGRLSPGSHGFDEMGLIFDLSDGCMQLRSAAIGIG